MTKKKIPKFEKISYIPEISEEDIKRNIYLIENNNKIDIPLNFLRHSKFKKDFDRKTHAMYQRERHSKLQERENAYKTIWFAKKDSKKLKRKVLIALWMLYYYNKLFEKEEDEHEKYTRNRRKI